MYVKLGLLRRIITVIGTAHPHVALGDPRDTANWGDVHAGELHELALSVAVVLPYTSSTDFPVGHTSSCVGAGTMASLPSHNRGLPVNLGQPLA